MTREGRKEQRGQGEYVERTLGMHVHTPKRIHSIPYVHVPRWSHPSSYASPLPLNTYTLAPVQACPGLPVPWLGPGHGDAEGKLSTGK